MKPGPASENIMLAENSIESLWQEFSAPVRGFLRARTHSHADAEDLLQNVFLRIHRQLATLRDTSKLQGWVYRIARNALIDYYRGKREMVPFAPDTPADNPSGENAVDLSSSLHHFIALLPEIYREALVRHEYQGEELKSIAASLGLSLTATKSRVRRARLMLRELLNRCCQFEFDRRGSVIEATPHTAASCPCATPPRRKNSLPPVSLRQSRSIS